MLMAGYTSVSVTVISNVAGVTSRRTLNIEIEMLLPALPASAAISERVGEPALSTIDCSVLEPVMSSGLTVNVQQPCRRLVSSTRLSNGFRQSATRIPPFLLHSITPSAHAHRRGPSGDR